MHYIAFLKDLLYIYDLPQAVGSNSLLYADYTFIVFQHKSIIESERQLIRNFSNLCDYFLDNKLNMHCKDSKTKLMSFGTKDKLQNAKSLNIVYDIKEIKWHMKVKYLGCILDESFSSESLTLNIVNKVNSCLKLDNIVFNMPFT